MIGARPGGALVSTGVCDMESRAVGVIDHVKTDDIFIVANDYEYAVAA